MPAFPRSAGALPRLATPPRFPSGLQSWGGSGRAQTRAVKNAGRVWTETYPLLDTQNPSVRALLEMLNRSIRSGLVWDIQHPYWHVRKGIGGGSPVTHSPIQLVVDPENFGAWTNIGTPIVTSGQTDPYGGAAAYRLQDDDGAAPEGKVETVTFSGNGTKAISLFMKQGAAPPAAGNVIVINDATAVAERMRATITWSGGVPTVVMSSGGVQTRAPEVWPGGWYRFYWQATGVLAANVNQFQCFAATTAGTGDGFFFGANAWNSTVIGPYRGPSNAGPLGGPGAQDGAILFVRGAPVSTSAWLRQGDLIDFPGCPFVLDVTAQVDTDTAGGAQITISPPLFTNYYVADNVAVTTDPTQIFFSAVIDGLETPPGMDSTRYLQAGLAVTWREALP